MRIEQQTAPETTPILIDEIKDHLRVDGAEEDASLGALGAAAVTLIESYLGLALVDRPVVIYLDAWPSAPARPAVEAWWSGVAEGAITELQQAGYHAPLPVRPVAAVDTVEITTASGDTVIWQAENYYLKKGLSPALVRKYGRAWPVPGTASEGIKIKATAGFGPDWNHVPAGIRQALLMLVTHLYYNRGQVQGAVGAPATGGGNPITASGAAGMLTAYREMRL